MVRVIRWCSQASLLRGVRESLTQVILEGRRLLSLLCRLQRRSPYPLSPVRRSCCAYGPPTVATTEKQMLSERLAHSANLLNTGNSLRFYPL